MHGVLILPACILHVCMCFAKESTDRGEREKKEKRTEKMKSDPLKAREYIHGCLTMKNDERNTTELRTYIEKRKKQMDISLIVI